MNYLKNLIKYGALSCMLLGITGAGLWKYNNQQFNYWFLKITNTIKNMNKDFLMSKSAKKVTPRPGDISKDFQDDLFIMGNIYIKQN